MPDVLEPSTPVTSAGRPAQSATRFELAADESAGAGLHRIMLEQVDLATWHTRRLADGDEHAHGVRKAAKRMRAVVRMVRDGLDTATYRHDNAVIRDVARDLSDWRKAMVLVATHRDLIQGHSAPHAGAQQLQSELVAEAGRLRGAVVGDADLIDDLVDRLRRVGASAANWSLPPALIPTTMGLGRTYRRGRRGMVAAYAEPDTGRFHEWRKRVKYLRHQIEVLAPMRPPTLTPLASDLATISDGLGLDHDLADLGSLVDDFEHPALTAEGRIDLLAAIDVCRNRLRAEIEPMARLRYADEPPDFVAELTSYWRHPDNWKGRPGEGEVASNSTHTRG